MDERFNGGGFIPDFFVERLRRTTWAYWSTRDGKDFHTPPPVGPTGDLPLSHGGGPPAPGGQARGRAISPRVLTAVLAASIALAVICDAWLAHGAGTQSCSPQTVGVDTSLADPSLGVGAINGEGPGETFMAADTLIRSITVWRAAVQTPNATPMKLWITEVDSTGTPLIGQVVFDGPALFVPYGDGIHPIKIQYSFDPPIALPHRGRYFFAVQELCWGWFHLLVSAGDPYADGSLWRTGRSNFSGCILAYNIHRISDYDLVFTVEFCRDMTTATHRRSWGQIKTIYR